MKVNESPALKALLEELDDHCDWLNYYPTIEQWEKSTKQLNKARVQYLLEQELERQNDREEAEQETTIYPNPSNI